MMYAKAIGGLLADVRGTALTRLQALDFQEVADLEIAAAILKQVEQCETIAHSAYMEISEILDAM